MTEVVAYMYVHAFDHGQPSCLARCQIVPQQALLSVAYIFLMSLNWRQWAWFSW